MKYLLISISILMLFACSGSKSKTSNQYNVDNIDGKPKYTKEDLVSRAVLDKAELTTEVDEKRFRAAAPTTTKFDPYEDIIYFVGKLKRTPTDATIEVRWFLDSNPLPMLISDIQGSSTFSFVASFLPTEKKFRVGNYTARVFVNNREVGGASFVIGNPDQSKQGQVVSKVKFSKAITGKMKPKKPKTKFKKGTKKIYVTFDIKGAELDSTADIFWYRLGEEFHNASITLKGNRRYGVDVESPGGLPDGEYKVEIMVNSILQATKTIRVGSKVSNGPSIDEIEFGLVLKSNNMPKKQMTTFKRDTTVIQCGLRFLDIRPESVIEIHWVLLEDKDEVLLYKTRSALPSGGSGTMGAAWEPDYELRPGDYKVMVFVNDEPLAEEDFEVN